jgi:probable rRNA maturation factor
MHSIAVANRQKLLKIDVRLLKRYVRQILDDASIASSDISIAVVDDREIARVHGEFLDDPTPTDVISFILDCSDGHLEGEIVASAETAQARAAEYEQSPERELLLYVIHGALHLVGYDDTTAAERKKMRAQEKHYLAIGQRAK